EVSARVEKAVEQALAPWKVANGSPVWTTMISDSGLPSGRTALFTSNTGPHSGNLQVNLVSHGDRALSDAQLTDKVRAALRDAFPGVQVYYFTGGIVKRILNFGSPAPIDVEILGYDLQTGSEFAKRVHAALRNLSDSDGKPLLT